MIETSKDRDEVFEGVMAHVFWKFFWSVFGSFAVGRVHTHSRRRSPEIKIRLVSGK